MRLIAGIQVVPGSAGPRVEMRNVYKKKTHDYFLKAVVFFRSIVPPHSISTCLFPNNLNFVRVSHYLKDISNQGLP